mmetsp:Transcript_127472/g.248427  ORF Transcript_127472/g.248427 Transcript_127472/m.248427 type:complete len:433 (-) Transcript_127472:31-1329(-)
MAPSEDLYACALRCGATTAGKGICESSKRRMLGRPRGLTVSSDGTLYVADFGNHCVFRFKPGEVKGRVVAGEEGKILPTVDPLKDIDRPLGPLEGEGKLLKRPVAVILDEKCASDGEVPIFVADVDTCKVQRFSTSSGALSTVIVPPDGREQRSMVAPEAIKYPRCLLQSSDGGIILCDTWSQRVLKFPASGTEEALAGPTLLAGTPNSLGAGPEKLAFPSGIALEPDGSLLVADTNNNRVQRFAPGDLKGKTVAGSSSGKAGQALSELKLPTNVCCLKAGGFVVTDRGNGRVLHFPHDGGDGVLIAGPPLLERPWGVCESADGDVFVSDERLGVVLRFWHGDAQRGFRKGEAVWPPPPQKPLEAEPPAPDAEDEVEATPANQELAFNPPPRCAVAADVKEVEAKRDSLSAAAAPAAPFSIGPQEGTVMDLD